MFYALNIRKSTSFSPNTCQHVQGGGVYV
ncbi:MAG: hypothetical protein DRG58_01930 [Deltaproteobacteria bacterium]|nr:MAG: hypothetical protein DRG58_01930 [Deltaproteobacteria bacterium]